MSLVMLSLREHLGRRTHLTAISVTVAVRVVLLGLSMATTVLVARQLGSAGRGEYAVALAVTGIGVQLANLGIHTSSLWAVARSPRLLGSLLANGLLLALALGATTAAIGWLVLGVIPGSPTLSSPLLLVALLTIPFGLTYLLAQNLLLGLDRVRSYNLLEIANRSMAFIGIALLAVTGVLTSFFAVTATSVAVALAAVAATAVLYRLAITPLRPRVALVTEYGGYGLRVYASALFTFLALRLDYLLLGRLGGASAAGEYSIAVSIAEVVTLPAVVSGTILLPRFAAMRDESRRAGLTARYTVLAVMATALLASVAALGADPLIEFLFGEEFAPATAAVLLLMPGSIAFGMYSVLSSYYYAVGTPRVIVVVPLGGLLANVALDLALIPPYGIAGAAVASSIAYGVMAMTVAGAYLVRQWRRSESTGGPDGADTSPG